MTSKSPYSLCFLTDGLSKKRAQARYQKRRDALLSQLSSPTVIVGPSTSSSGPEVWNLAYQPLYQEPLLLYLTGVNQPQTALLLDPGKTPHVQLFLPTYSPKSVFWEGDQFWAGEPDQIDIARSYTGISTINERATLNDHILQSVSEASSPRLGLFWNQSRKTLIKDHNQHFRRSIKAWLAHRGHPVDMYNIDPLIWPHRLYLDPTDVQNVKTAITHTRTAFLEVLQTLDQFQTETALSGFLVGQLHQQTEFGLSFPPIVASGKNATTLHYNRNNDPIGPNELVLLDFGSRWQSVCSDISRTVPKSGRFNPLQRLLYQLVLDTQLFVESQVKPGITIQELNDACWAYLENGLKERFTQCGGRDQRAYTTMPHFVSHLMGIQVHDGDPFRAYRDRPLKPGNLLSNEPGLYGFFEITINGKSYREHIGIRIEDDLLVTSNGCQNLSQSIPKTVAEIEGLLRP